MATIRAHAAPFFDGVAEGDLRLVHEYLTYWSVLRRCCGPQSSKQRRMALHGLGAYYARDSEALDNAHCEIYDLDATEEALFNTTLWRARGGRDFLQISGVEVKRGICCYTALEMARGVMDFKGDFRPTPEERAYLRDHGDPRTTAPKDDLRCRYRDVATANARPYRRGKQGGGTPPTRVVPRAYPP